MKLTAIPDTPQAEYDYLRQTLDSQPECCPYRLDYELPPGCTPSEATLNLMRNGNEYAVFFEPPVLYSGANAELSRICKGFRVYENWDELESAFHCLPDASAQTLPVVSEVQTPAKLDASILKELQKTVKGQDGIAVVAHEVALFISKPESRRCLSFLLWGPSGVGKTETARAVADILSRYGSHPYSFVATDLNQYDSPGSKERLIGAPPSYIGFDSPPVFAEIVNNPYCVMLFDELDKADASILELFMSIMDTGKCQANKVLKNGSREYDFSHAILFFTGNYSLESPAEKRIGFSIASDVREIQQTEEGVEISYRENAADEPKTSLEQRILADNEAARKAFIKQGVRPEVANRFTAFVRYTPLSDEAKREILAKMVIEAGFEWHIKIGRIAPGFLNSLGDAIAGRESQNIRAAKVVIEGRLANCFAETAAQSTDALYLLGGTLDAPRLAIM